MKISISNVCHAFDGSSIGTKVVLPKAFIAAVTVAIPSASFNDNGHAFITLDKSVAKAAVSAGVGHPTSNPEDYVLRSHRGVVSAFLNRCNAVDIEGCSVIVYTYEGYMSDPDINEDREEQERIKSKEPDYIVVAVLGFAGPKPQVSAHRFVANLSGGNKDFDGMTSSEIVNAAKAVMAYSAEWDVVSD